MALREQYLEAAKILYEKIANTCDHLLDHEDCPHGNELAGYISELGPAAQGFLRLATEPTGTAVVFPITAALRERLLGYFETQDLPEVVVVLKHGFEVGAAPIHIHTGKPIEA